MKTPVHFTQIIPTLPFLSLKNKTKTKTFFETIKGKIGIFLLKSRSSKIFFDYKLKIFLDF